MVLMLERRGDRAVTIRSMDILCGSRNNVRTKSKKMTKAYSYIRFSTPEQRKGHSLERQLEDSRLWAKGKGLILDESLQDLGLSAFHGLHKLKGAFGKFLKLIEDGEIEKGSYLIIENLDRISRQEVVEALTQFLLIINAGIIIVTLQDDMVYSKESVSKNSTQLFISITIMTRSHEESLTKSKRIKSAWVKKRETISKNLKLTGKCPAWLTPVKVKIAENRYKVIGYEKIKGAKEVINQIFDMKLEGFGSNRIAKELNKREPEVWKPKPRVRTLKDGTKVTRPASWRPSYIVKLLHNNRELLGEYQPHILQDGVRVPIGDPIPNYFPAIISEKKFYEVYNSIEEHLKTHGFAGGRNDKMSNLFGHMAVCSQCGYPMRFLNKGDTSKGGQYLKCDKELRKVDGGCVSVSIRYDLVENKVLEHCVGLDVSEILPDSITIQSQIRSLNKEISSINGKLSTIEGYITNLANRIKKTPNEDVQKRLDYMMQEHMDEQKGLLAQKKELKEQKDSLSDSERRTIEQIKDIQELIVRMNNITGEERINFRLSLRTQLRGLIKSIRVNTEDQVITLFFTSGQRRAIGLRPDAPQKIWDAFPKAIFKKNS